LQELKEPVRAPLKLVEQEPGVEADRRMFQVRLQQFDTKRDEASS
jgi:hypothetical protein